MQIEVATVYDVSSEFVIMNFNAPMAKRVLNFKRYSWSRVRDKFGLEIIIKPLR